MAIPTGKPITGIPDPTEFGDISSLPKDRALPFVVQEHLARKAGKHYDVRLGPERMFSWATRKGLPLPGDVQALYQTPLHEESYMHYEGTLPKGMYGAGAVKPVDKGSVIVHKAEPGKLIFTTGHTRYPQTFVMIRTGKKPTDWIVRNLTPKSLESFAGPGVEFGKEHYKSAPPEEIVNMYDAKKVVSEKIDGARMLLKLKKHHVEAASYRQSVTGYPIMHTARLQLPRNLNIPSSLVGSTLVGETYGERIPDKEAMAPEVVNSVLQQLNKLDPIQRGAILHALRNPVKGPTGQRILKNFMGTFMPKLQPAAVTQPFKTAAYRDSRMLKKLLAKLRGPVAPDTIEAKTGLNASSMLTGSDAPRLEQGLKMGGVPIGALAVELLEQAPKLTQAFMHDKEPKESIPALKVPLPKVIAKHEQTLQQQEMPAQEGRGAAEIKMATAIGRVEPEIARHPIDVKDTQPKRPKKLIPDTRQLLQDKAAAEKPGIGLFSRFLKRTHKHIQRVCDNASKLVKRYPGKYAGLIGQSRKHDKSKFSQTELVPYMWLTEFYRHDNNGKKFDYPKGMKDRVDKACIAHINGNRHHVEYHGDVSKMTKIDIAEMVCDWAAMSQELGTPLRPWVARKIKKDKFTDAQVDLINEILDVFEPREKAAQEAIPVQELGGILNSSLAESLRKQREQKVQLRTAVFNILSKGNKPIGPEVPYNERIKMIQEILGHLPETQFHLPEMATTPEAQRVLFESIQAGKNPRTREGVVVTPETGTPTKIKFMPESDVTVRSVFPGEGKYEGLGAGGFNYSLPGSEKVVGKVGTGLSDELRQRMLKHQQEYIGRIARIRSTGQYPSGAHRAPALIAMHEG